ncbi:hypothetical protein [Tunturiibacter lichenicola]|uniref:hypothetical protein n=1 Tax=Tunturiibacter lichenicola TaxID=2051959 RepID=UPI003D9AF598
MRIRLRINDWSGEEGIPQGLKPLSSSFAGRPKAEALGYLEAKAITVWNGMADEGKNGCEGKDIRRSALGMTIKEQAIATAKADPCGMTTKKATAKTSTGAKARTYADPLWG